MTSKRSYAYTTTKSTAELEDAAYTKKDVYRYDGDPRFGINVADVTIMEKASEGAKQSDFVGFERDEDPDGGFRGWGCIMPLKLGARTRYFWLTFDRHNGSDYNGATETSIVLRRKNKFNRTYLGR